MFIHHLATVGLISFSYVNNMVRVGSLVMCVHDASDFLLEVGEMIVITRYESFLFFFQIVWKFPKHSIFLGIK